MSRINAVNYVLHAASALRGILGGMTCIGSHSTAANENANLCMARQRRFISAVNIVVGYRSDCATGLNQHLTCGLVVYTPRRKSFHYIGITSYMSGEQKQLIYQGVTVNSPRGPPTVADL